jgi:hypothetical protein
MSGFALERLSVTSGGGEVDMTFTLVRSEWCSPHFASIGPLATDIPEDARAALRAWLDTAPAEHVLHDLSEHILAAPGAKGFHAFRARRLGDRFEVDFHLQVAETATVAEGHAIAGRIKADILKSHPEVVSVLVHVEPDAPEHRKQDGHHGFGS